MTIKRITDRHNARKVWIIKRYKCGHFYVNQEICGRVFYPAYRRLTKRFITEILEEV